MFPLFKKKSVSILNFVIKQINIQFLHYTIMESSHYMYMRANSSDQTAKKPTVFEETRYDIQYLGNYMQQYSVLLLKQYKFLIKTIGQSIIF